MTVRVPEVNVTTGTWNSPTEQLVADQARIDAAAAQAAAWAEYDAAHPDEPNPHPFTPPAAPLPTKITTTDKSNKTFWWVAGGVAILLGGYVLLPSRR